MALIKYTDVITNTRGDSLPDYRVQVVTSAGAGVDLFADGSGTRFRDVSGNVVNYATASSTGKVEFYWTPAEGQILQTLDTGGTLVDTDADFADKYVLGNLVGEVPQDQVTDLPADLAAKADAATTTAALATKASSADLASTDADKGAAMLKDKLDAEGAVELTQKQINGEVISVKRFGAVGDGATDDSAAIGAADAAAALQGKRLFFPAGTYNTGFLTMTAKGWFGEGPEDSILQYTGSATGANFYPLVQADGVSGAWLDNLGFDGNCSDDPVTWSAANYDTFTGAAGPSIDNCSNPKITNCRATNVSWSGFRFYRVAGGLMDNLKTVRARGSFGDGMLVLSSTDVTMRECNPEDYTRIGVCADRIDSPGEPLCERITIVNCNPSNGHDGSILYGGGEYSCGVWAENCIDVTIDGVKPVNQAHRGVVCATGDDPAFDRSKFSISNSICRDCGDVSFIVESLGVPIDATFASCAGYGAKSAFVANINDGSDSIIHVDCHADYDASTNNAGGFRAQVATGLTGKPKYQVDGSCTVSRYSTNSAFLTTIDPNVAVTSDIGNSNVAAALNLVVGGVKASDGGPVYIRWHGAVAHEISVTDTHSWVSYGETSGGSAKFTGGKVSYANVFSGAGEIVFAGGKTVGPIFATANVVRYGHSTDIGDGSKVQIASNSASKFPAIFVGGELHQKDINANGAIFNVLPNNGCSVFFDGFKLFNKGSASASNAWIDFTGTANFYASNVLADDTVTPLFSSGTSTFAGITKVAFK